MIFKMLFIIIILLAFSSFKEKEKAGLDYILDSVHHNLGEGETKSVFMHQEKRKLL